MCLGVHKHSNMNLCGIVMGLCVCVQECECLLLVVQMCANWQKIKCEFILSAYVSFIASIKKKTN